MQIQKFKDDYELAAEVYDRTPDELRRRDEQRGQPLRRWLALANNRIVAAVSAWLRPGTDGWRGNRQWFHDEFVVAPVFDPSGYHYRSQRGQPGHPPEHGYWVSSWLGECRFTSLATG